MRPINLIVADHYSSPHETALLLRNQSAAPISNGTLLIPPCVNTAGLPWILRLSFCELNWTEGFWSRGCRRFDRISSRIWKGKGRHCVLKFNIERFCRLDLFYKFLWIGISEWFYEQFKIEDVGFLLLFKLSLIKFELDFKGKVLHFWKLELKSSMMII